MQREVYLCLHHVLHGSGTWVRTLAQKVSSLDELKEQFPKWLEKSKLDPTKHSFLKQHVEHFNALRYLQTLQAKNIQCVTLFDDHYPSRLRLLPDPPSVLYYRGNLSLSETATLAVVGPRQCSAYGEQVTRSFVKTLAGSLTIVSGLAQGIDALAHHTTLEVNGATIAVMGTGFDRIYPESNTALFHSIVEKGLVLTEYPLGIEPRTHFFPKRNRIISGLSMGVLVIEAADKSGSLITARLAMEQSREVMAIPGPVFSAHSAGVHKLIQDGAQLVHSPEDVFLTLNLSSHATPLPFMHAETGTTEHAPSTQSQAAVPTLLNPIYLPFWEALNQHPKPLDVLIEESGLLIHQVFEALTQLELEGIIKEHPGKQYTRL